MVPKRLPEIAGYVAAAPNIPPEVAGYATVVPKRLPEIAGYVTAVPNIPPEVAGYATVVPKRLEVAGYDNPNRLPELFFYPNNVAVGALTSN